MVAAENRRTNHAVSRATRDHQSFCDGHLPLYERFWQHPALAAFGHAPGARWQAAHGRHDRRAAAHAGTHALRQRRRGRSDAQPAPGLHRRDGRYNFRTTYDYNRVGGGTEVIIRTDIRIPWFMFFVRPFVLSGVRGQMSASLEKLKQVMEDRLDLSAPPPG